MCNPELPVSNFLLCTLLSGGALYHLCSSKIQHISSTINILVQLTRHNVLVSALCSPLYIPQYDTSLCETVFGLFRANVLKHRCPTTETATCEKQFQWRWLHYIICIIHFFIIWSQHHVHTSLSKLSMWTVLAIQVLLVI